METYKFLINKHQDELEKSFNELLKIHNDSMKDDSLSDAVLDLENKMDQESFDNFVKLKLESFKKDSIK